MCVCICAYRYKIYMNYSLIFPRGVENCLVSRPSQTGTATQNKSVCVKEGRTGNLLFPGSSQEELIFFSLKELLEAPFTILDYLKLAQFCSGFPAINIIGAPVVSINKIWGR